MHDKPFSLTAIVAYDVNHGIGLKGSIPWKLPKDMEHFRKTTRSGVVIMGRKTWDSLPVKPLPIEPVSLSLEKIAMNMVRSG